MVSKRVGRQDSLYDSLIRAVAITILKTRIKKGLNFRWDPSCGTVELQRLGGKLRAECLGKCLPGCAEAFLRYQKCERGVRWQLVQWA